MATPKKRKSVYDEVVSEHLARLERLAERRGVSRLKKVYDTATAEVVSKIARLTGARRGSTFDAHQKRLVLAQLAHGQQYVAKQVGGELEDAARDTQSDVLRALPRAITRLENEFRGTAPVVPIEDVARFQGIITGRRDSMLRRHETSLDKYGQRNVAKAEDALSQSLLQGESHVEAIDRVNEVLHSQWWEGERIVRTELAWAASATQADGIGVAREVIPELQIQWRELVSDEGIPLDDRVGVDSISLHLQVIVPGGMFVCPPRTPEGEEVPDSLSYEQIAHPPNRPNDRSSIVPWRSGWGVPAWRWAGRRVPMR